MLLLARNNLILYYNTLYHPDFSFLPHSRLLSFVFSYLLLKDHCLMG